ncbi:hypothetical protein [Nostoc punctiforme]|uniref:Uncharacterized protein n=1 Tax=Nostoc punctiforme NIES-2108 TaxID=1356359 RepID=A0A367R0V1_NOSPU|nr:hypothetical protein [Nostoc punctiforme]RCJ29203.1 hypothetical protein A6769_36010 [Nostoc punctiforme NIES-2108]
MVWSTSTFPELALPTIDPSMQAIATYIKDGLNDRIGELKTGIVAVRHAICYNSLPADLSSFPLLKVYRNTDNFTWGQNTTQMTIGYCLSFPDEERIPGILRWVAVNIDSLMREYGINHRGCCPSFDPESQIKAEYRVMSLNGEPVYTFLLVNFEITEDIGCNE